jgi:quercetin dioxygenase-like cupin family protein
MPVIRAKNTRKFSISGLSVTGLAAPSCGSAETSVWRLHLEPDAPGAAHSLDREEIFVALSGHAKATLGEERLELGPGDVLVVPAGVSFSLAGAGGDGFEALAVAPVGVRACFPGGDAFAPPWTE